MGKEISEDQFKFLIKEAVEDIALAHAVREGKKTGTISKEDILALIEKRT